MINSQINTKSLLSYGTVGFLALLPLTVRAQSQSTPYTPTSAYEVRQIAKFRVLVNPKTKEHPSETSVALKLLETKLTEITRLLPAERLEPLRKVTFWVEWDAKPNGAAEYHVSADWLRSNGYNPEKAGGIEINNVRNFVAWQQQDQPMMVLHELSHGYYYRVLGGDKATEVSRAFDNAVKSGLYQSVGYVHGGKKRAYALTNKMEYFAEITEAYFGRNDFYPFIRQELKEYDPTGYALMESAWSKPRTEKGK